MSFFIRNLTVSDIEINDLGLTVEVGTDLDLLPEDATSIAISTELMDSITAGNLIVLNPLDGVTPLSVVESLKVVQLANDPHYGIQGGKLNQIDDVNVAAPTHDDVLTYNAISGNWEPAPSTGGGGSPLPPTGEICFPFYRADGTLDTIESVAGLFPFYRADNTYDPIIMGTCN